MPNSPIHRRDDVHFCITSVSNCIGIFFVVKVDIYWLTDLLGLFMLQKYFRQVVNFSPPAGSLATLRKTPSKTDFCII